jgi:hypothetical protein
VRIVAIAAEQGQPWQNTVAASSPGQSQVDSRATPPIRNSTERSARFGEEFALIVLRSRPAMPHREHRGRAS